MQHVDTVLVELTEHQATWAQYFAQGQAGNSGPWGQMWTALGAAFAQGLERLCLERQAERENEDAQFDDFLDIIFNGRHHDNCRVNWNGKHPRTEFTLHWDDQGPHETVQHKRQRVRAELSRIKRGLRRWIEIDVNIRHGKPTHAVVKVRPEAMPLFRFGTAPLSEPPEN